MFGNERSHKVYRKFRSIAKKKTSKRKSVMRILLPNHFLEVPSKRVNVMFCCCYCWLLGVVFVARQKNERDIFVWAATKHSHKRPMKR
jgi:hypothetical protein